MQEFGLGVELSASLASGEFGLDGKNDFHGALDDVVDGGADLVGEVVFDPATDEEIGHTDFEVSIFNNEAGGVFEPDSVTLLPDFLEDGGVNFLHQVCTRGVHGDSPGLLYTHCGFRLFFDTRRRTRASEAFLLASSAPEHTRCCGDKIHVKASCEGFNRKTVSFLSTTDI